MIKAEALNKGRLEAAARLDTAVIKELPPLKLERALFETQVVALSEEDWGADGIDRVEFMVATNPGAAPGPLGKIASGGELSRFMLALKIALVGVGTAGTLIFDEVDSGVGGATADAVGERLERLGAGKRFWWSRIRRKLPRAGMIILRSRSRAKRRWRPRLYPAFKTRTAAKKWHGCCLDRLSRMKPGAPPIV